MELQGFMERQKIPSYFLNVTKRCAGVTASEYRMMPDNQHEDSLPLYNLEKAKSKGEGPYL